MYKMSKIQTVPWDNLAGDELLRTKFTVPRLRTPLVERTLLIERLDQNLTRSVTLISAPAGFGKTTFIRSWIASHAEQQDLPPLAWVSLDDGDNDPMRFWRYTLTACQVFRHELGQEALALMNNSMRSSFESALTLFINELSQFSDKGILVLEDYHVITSTWIHETLAFLVDYLPESLHLILITRGDPPLPLARWRAHHDLCEFRATDLRFSAEETKAFLEQAIAIPLAPETVSHLHERTEGWIAGLHLLVLALQGRQNRQEIEQILGTFTGSHQHILEYLVADVLSIQPPALQSFLLQTSILSRLNGSLCAAITERADSAALLAQLDRANLFLLPLDGTGQWYRYHALFAEAMQHEARQQLGEEKLQELFLKASHWYEKHQLIYEAIETALSAQAFTQVAALIEDMVDSSSFQNEYYSLRRWIEQLPTDLIATYPILCFTYAIALLFTSDRYALSTKLLIEKPLSLAEHTWQTEQNTARLGEALTLRTMVYWWQGDFTEAFQIARQAIELLTDESNMWRGICLIYIGVAEFVNGHLDAARQATMEAHHLNETAQNTYAVRATVLMQTRICLAEGKLQQASELYRNLLDEAEKQQDFQDQSEALQGMGILAYEWNDLERAEQYIHQSQERSKRFPEDELIVHNGLLLARIQHAHGQTEQALQQLSALAAYAQRRPHLLREIHTWQTKLALAAGDQVAAECWSDTIGQYSDPEVFLERMEHSLLIARLHIASGSSSEALHSLQAQLDEAQTHKFTPIILETLLLQTLAHAALKEIAQARQSLLQALTLARVEGYQRTFLDEGEALSAVLRTVLSDTRDELLTEYVRSLLPTLPGPSTQTETRRPQPSTTQHAVLIEPLSPQERRVLRLLAAGLSNPEIAQELVVSINTIKTQVQSIYHKLNVNSRHEARTAAQQLHLL